MSNTRQTLGKAFELIRQDKLSEAITLVKPITEAEPENADAWWLLANAHEEPRDARRALVNVLKINPSYPKARDLLDKLNDLYPPRDDELLMMMDIPEVEDALPTAATPPPSAPEVEGLDDLFSDGSVAEVDELFTEPAKPSPKRRTSEVEDLFSQPPPSDDEFGLSPDDNPFESLLSEEGDDDDAPSGRRRLVRALMLVMVLLLVCMAGAVLLLGGGDDEGTTEAETTQAPAGGELTAEGVNAANAAVLEDVRRSVETDAQQRLENAKAVFAQAPDGTAGLVVRFCAKPSPDLPRLVSDGMRLVANRVGSTPSVQSDLAFVGITAEDCLRGNDLLYRASSPLQAAVNFSANQADFNTFQAAWTVEN